MKMPFSGILAVLVLWGSAYSQQTSPPQTNSAPAQAQPAPAKGDFRVAPGSIIPVQLTKTIDAKKMKEGDQVEAKVTQDLKNASGHVVVPKDTKVTGRVTEAHTHSPDQKESQLGIAFDHAVTKAGLEASMPMSIQAIIAQRNPDADNGAASDTAEPSIAQSNAGEMPPANRPSTGMGNAPAVAPTPPSENDLPAGAQAGPDTRAPITAQTQGVVGIPNLTLLTAAGAAQGSVVSSAKGSVKLESGTWMLLRVDPVNP